MNKPSHKEYTQGKVNDAVLEIQRIAKNRDRYKDVTRWVERIEREVDRINHHTLIELGYTIKQAEVVAELESLRILNTDVNI